MAETAWELAELFVLRPLLAVSFALSFILLSWYVAWRTVLVHVPLVQEVAGLRPNKKPAKPKPPNRGRIGRFYQSQAQAQRVWLFRVLHSLQICRKHSLQIFRQEANCGRIGRFYQPQAQSSKEERPRRRSKRSI